MYMRAKSIELIMKFNSFRRVATHLAAACITTLTPFLLFSIFAFRRPFHMIRSVGINAIIDLFLFQQFFLNYFFSIEIASFVFGYYWPYNANIANAVL